MLRALRVLGALGLEFRGFGLGAVEDIYPQSLKDNPEPPSSEGTETGASGVFGFGVQS